MSRKLLSVVIPLLNEAENLEALHAALKEGAASVNRDVEFVFVDDGSTDQSYEKLKQMRALDSRVRFIRLSRNFGSHGACIAGFAHCRGDHAVTLAADLQDPPGVLQPLLDAADRGHDVVLGTRAGRDDPWFTVLFSNLYHTLMRRLALPNYPPTGFDLVLVSRRVYRLVVDRHESNTSIFGQILWLGFPQASVPYQRLARKSGRSKWTLAKKMKLAIDSFVSFSYVPVRLISLFGFVIAGLGLLYAALVVALRLTLDVPIEGWASLMVAVMVIGGVQLVMLGVIGEYLWRTLDQTRARPPFIVSDAVGFGEGVAWSSEADAASSPVAPVSSAVTL